MNSIVSTVAMSVGLAVALLFAGLYLSKDNHHAAVWWFLAAWIFAGVGVAFEVRGWLVDREERAAAEASRLQREAKETARQDAGLRPYVGVSYVKATMEIGKPVSILIRFTNTGKTPAENTEILMRFQKLPAGSPIDQDFTGNDFSRRSVGSVSVGNTVESEVVGHEWTLDELMHVTTKGTHGIFAHGVIRYRSKYIPGGIEETQFCYEFDRTSGQMVICRLARERAAATAP